MKEFDIKETGMFVPDGFFDKFQKELEAKIDQQEAEKLKIKAAKKQLSIRRWSIAACACLIIGLSPVVWHFMKEPSAAQSEIIDPLYSQVDYSDSDIESEDEIMVSMISDMDIYENFYAEL